MAQTDGSAATPPPAPPRQAPFPWLDLLGRAGAISALLAAWLMLAGWSFAYHYFAGFGIGVSELDLDLKALPIWGTVAVYDLRWWVLAGALCLFLMMLLAGSARLPGAARVLVLILAIAAAYAGAVVVGRVKAGSDLRVFRTADWPGFVPVKVYMDAPPGAESELGQITTDLRDGCHRLIYADDSRLYLFRPIAGRPSLATTTTVVDRGDVKLVRLGPLGGPLCRN